jgi:hypothetical protein
MTTISTLATPWAQLEAALQDHRPVEVSYHGRCRLICPHAMGWHRGRPMVLGYQTGGQTSTGALNADPHKRWRCLYVDEIDHVAIADPPSQWQSADNYNPAHPFAAIDQVAIADPGHLNAGDRDHPAANSR